MILNYLTNGQICSKNKLKEKLHCSDMDIEKNLLSLQQQGIELLISGDKVQLKPLLPLLDIPFLKNALTAQNVHYQQVINSTNQYLLNNILTLNKGDICVAEYQNSGRGRRGKNWISPFAGQIILSLYWSLPRTVDLNGLSLVVGLAIAETLSEAGVENIGLKWPNDILLAGRKLAGILVEIAPNKNDELQLVIGLGINIAFPSEKIDVGQPYAQLQEYLPNINRSELIVLLTKKLYLYLTLFEKKGMALFHSQWNSYDAFYGQEVCLIEQNKKITGIEHGIDSFGFLQLKIEGMQGLQKFNIGDLSLRKKDDVNLK